MFHEPQKFPLHLLHKLHQFMKSLISRHIQTRIFLHKLRIFAEGGADGPVRRPPDHSHRFLHRSPLPCAKSAKTPRPPLRHVSRLTSHLSPFTSHNPSRSPRHPPPSIAPSHPSLTPFSPPDPLRQGCTRRAACYNTRPFPLNHHADLRVRMHQMPEDVRVLSIHAR
jgi:hypothetical protein